MCATQPNHHQNEQSKCLGSTNKTQDIVGLPNLHQLENLPNLSELVHLWEICSCHRSYDVTYNSSIQNLRKMLQQSHTTAAYFLKYRATNNISRLISTIVENVSIFYHLNSSKLIFSSKCSVQSLYKY